MRIDPSDLAAEQAYRLLTGIVVPRPIAWVTTLSGDGVVNLAPFSAFTFVSPKPPMLAISVGRKAGVYKDTAHNILNNEEFVVHIADSSLMNAVHESSTEHPPDVSEVEELNLETLPSERVKVRVLPWRQSRWSAGFGSVSNSARLAAASWSAKSWCSTSATAFSTTARSRPKRSIRSPASAGHATRASVRSSP
ncbi:MAG: flavin reductase family protein [Bradyrhizobium sp.]|uniref:flavin reductase family protein n=1 Tax=Bradyrhizobium sp. TaxID=376 RepID=UPI0027182377|nr:flavin reductase family protein [Bradyrhizobium sp.]MDO8398829.1 flavin reductase family protein [Bradyrhizobium sp.]